MPLQPNLLERFLINRGMVPGLLLDLALPMFQFWTMISAMEIGLFDHLDSDSPLDVPTLAEKTNASERGIERLVQALEPLGYLESSDGRYELSAPAKRSLPVELLPDMVPYFKHSMRAYSDAARAVREAPEDGIYGWEHVQSGEIGRSYQTTMRWLGSQTVDEVVKKIDLPRGAERMLDVGGSHGLYTVAFCEKYPELTGSVLDWEIGLAEARKTLDEHPHMTDRIDLVERDFEKEELPTGYDFAFLGNIIHGIDPEGNRELFQKLGRSTTDRATVAIMDQLEGVSGSTFAREVAALAGVNLFLFSGGRSYSFDRVKGWLSQAGFPHVSRKSLQQPGFSLVIGRRQPPPGWTGAVRSYFKQ
jgi:hypothetical protein